jgi:hypothetical protein
VFSRLRHQSFRPDQSGAVLGASALSRAHINRGSHFCQGYSRTGRKGRTESLKTCSSPRLFFSPHPEGSLLWHDRPDTPHTIINAPPRGPCAGGIDQPPLGRPHHRNRHRSRPRHSVAPPFINEDSDVCGASPPWCFAPLASCPLGASPPWGSAPTFDVAP